MVQIRLFYQVLPQEWEDDPPISEVISYNAAISACEKGEAWQMACESLCPKRGRKTLKKIAVESWEIHWQTLSNSSVDTRDLHAGQLYRLVAWWSY